MIPTISSELDEVITLKETTQRVEDLFLEAITLYYPPSLDIEDLSEVLDSSNRAMALALKRFKGVAGYAERIENIPAKFQSLKETPELEEYFKMQNLAGYLKLLECLDDLTVQELSPEALNNNLPDNNPYTNGYNSLLRQSFTSFYTKELLKTPELSLEQKSELWKISVSNTILLQNELQLVANTLKAELEQPNIPNEITNRYERRYNVVLNSLFENQSILFEISRNGVENTEDAGLLLELEKVYGSLGMYYGDTSNDPTMDPSKRVFLRNFKDLEYTSLRSLVAGIRSETIIYGALLNLMPNLNMLIGHENDTVFLDSVDPEGVYANLLSTLKACLPAGYPLGSIDVQKASDELDANGIADFVMVALPKNDTDFKPKPILFLEVKSEKDSRLESSLVIVEGTVPELNTTTGQFTIKSLSSRRALYSKGTPFSAHDFIKRYGNAVGSIRVPRSLVSMPESPLAIIGNRDKGNGLKLSGQLIGTRFTMLYGRDILKSSLNTDTKTTLEKGLLDLLTRQLDAQRDHYFLKQQV